MYFDFYTWKQGLVAVPPDMIQLPAANPLTMALDPYGIWGLGIFAGLALLVLFYIGRKRRELGWEATTLWAYALVSSLCVFEFPGVGYDIYQRAFQWTAGQSFAEMLLIPLAVLEMPYWIWRALTWFMVIDIVLVWCGVSMLTPWDFPSPSFDTAMLALYLPFSPFWLACLSIITIASTHGSTALLIILAQLTAIVLSKSRGWTWRNRLAGAAALCVTAAALVTIAHFHSHVELFDGSERLAMWARYMAFWQTSPWFVVFGVGTGSFIWCALLIDHFKAPTFFWNHNDWLQIAFDLGLIGLALAGATFRRAAMNAWRNPRLLAALFGAAAFMAPYHPLRFFPTMFVVALILRECIKKGPGDCPEPPYLTSDPQ